MWTAKARNPILPSMQSLNRKHALHREKWLYSFLSRLLLRMRKAETVAAWLDGLRSCMGSNPRWKTYVEQTRVFHRYFLEHGFPDFMFPTGPFDPWTVPIFIISYNRLDYLKQQIAVLSLAGYKNLIIIDNASTYKPLLSYLKSLPYQVEFLPQNLGHMALWQCPQFFPILFQQYYVLTDNDVVPDEHCPPDFVEHFYRILQRYPHTPKAGFSLRINDLPACYADSDKVRRWEAQFWKNRLDDPDELYDAPLDTTFALYRPGVIPADRRWFSAIRTGFPYCARHLPWYEDTSNPSTEFIYYKQSALAECTHY